MEYLKYLPYLLIVPVTYTLINIVTKQKKNALIKVMRAKKKDSKTIKFLKKKDLYKWVSPNYFIEESAEYKWKVSLRDYSLLLITGTLVGAFLLYGFFLSFSFTVLGIVLGLAFPRIIGFYKRKKYEEYVQEQLMLYLNSLANAVPSYENLNAAFKSILPLLQSPIKEDVEKCYLQYVEGRSIREAFQPFVMKYSYKDIKLFHDMLDLISKSGTDTDNVLLDIAFEFQEKKVYRQKIKVGMKPKRRGFQQTVILVATMPFMFLFTTSEDYIMFAGTLQGKIILALIIVSNIFAAIKVEQHSFFDPTESIQKIK